MFAASRAGSGPWSGDLRTLAAQHRGELGALYRAMGQLKDEAAWLEQEEGGKGKNP